MGNWDSYRNDLDALKIELEKLFEVRNDVMIRRVRIAEEEEQEMMKPTDEVVQLWLSKVQAVETEVDDLIRQISQEIEELHPGGFCFRNLLNMPSSYEFEDTMADKLQAVMNLITEGASVVADDEARVVTIPKDGGAPEIEEFVDENLPEDVPYDEGTIVGMDSIFTEVRRCLEEEGGEGRGYVGIIGLYGMGGVGKTTLLKQIYQKQNNFAVVIWVSVSKELRLEKIQEKIGMKIGLFDKVWKNKNFEEKASDILEILKEKKFVLLMDELWERVDLTNVGVPFPNPENSSKIVFTTRSLEICRLMEADRQFKINCLADEEAWQLFKASVGDETLHSRPEQVVDIAIDISKECSGLPLALASIGRALAGNKTPQEWRDVLGVLTRRSRLTSSISGSDDQLKKDIYYNLKLSYDHLQNDMFKSCLLYCCLFPRNDKISEGHLIDCWIGEGFLDDRLGARSQGYHIIDVLLSACLLEEEEEEDGNYVKMHNWIHDMTLWITTEIEEEKRNFFVCADADLTEPPEIEKWVNMTRISMTKNGFTNLENAPMCSHLQTLFLNKNKIEMISGDFFRFMPCLKVLNLSDNPLQELPSEISNLVSLQHLDLSHTAIKSLPNQLGALKKLKCLNLESTLELCAIPPRLISTLSVLHVLRLQGCGFLDQSGEDSVVCKDAQLLIEELFCLKNLSMLSIGLRNSHALQKLLSSYRLQSCIQSLWLHSLQHPKSIVISISYMNHLKTLRISECEYLEELEVDFVGEAQAQQARSNFYFLDEVIIKSCPNLQDLTWLILAPNLKCLEISHCYEFEEIIKVGKLSKCSELMRNLTPFSKLQFLKLSDLPNLRSIYWCYLPFPDLKEITITECPKLQTNLPDHSKVHFGEGLSDLSNKSRIKLNESIKNYCTVDLQVQSTRDGKEVLEVVNSFKKIVSGNEQVGGEFNRAKIDEIDGPCSVPYLWEKTPGLDAPLKELRTELLKDDGMQVSMVSAPGGAGKTTLVKKLCADDQVKEMPGLENLVLGPVIGLMLQQFYEEIKRAREKTKKFDVVLTSLQNTVISVDPKINEINRMDQEHDDYPKQEIVVFLKQLEKGKELVATCADIPSWNRYKRGQYAKRLADMDSSLRKLLEVQFQAGQVLYIKKMLSEMAAINRKLDRMNIQIPEGVSGGSKSLNAAAADQSSDDQTAGRQSRFEMRFRKKKENGETDIKLSF